MKITTAPLALMLLGLELPALAQGVKSDTVENMYFVCVPTKYVEETFGLDLTLNVKIRTEDCTRNSAKSKDCEPFRMDMSDLSIKSGYYVLSVKDGNDDDKPGQEFRLSRSKGTFVYNLTWGETVRMKFTGECELRKERLKY